MPQALPFIALGAAAAGALTGAYGQYQAGQAADAVGKYQSKVAKNNAILSERAAADAIQRGAIEESRARAIGRLTIGKQKAAFAASGINLTSETAIDIQTSQAGLNELDALTIRSNAAREALGFQQQGINYRSDAALAKVAGQQAKYGANLAAASSLLTGTAQVASQWYDFNKTPPSGGGTGGATRTTSTSSSFGYFSKGPN